MLLRCIGLKAIIMTIMAKKEIKTFKNYCTCGGYAWQMNGRPEAQPHMTWCRQYDEYAEWYKSKQNETSR